MRIAYLRNFTQSHCTEVHLAATLESLGHEVTRIQATAAVNEAATWLKAIGTPDFFLWTRTWTSEAMPEPLAELKRRETLTASYHLDLYVRLKREDGLDSHPLAYG